MGRKYLSLGQSQIIGQFCGAGSVALIFIGWEYRSGDNAMIPGSILKQRVVYSRCITHFCLMATVFVVSQFLPTYFQGSQRVWSDN